MSQFLTDETSSVHDCAGLIAQKAFAIALEKLKSAGENSSAHPDIKGLLSIAGFSQNGRNRIMHLSVEEIDALRASAPEENNLWTAYVNEIQLVLSKMDQARKKESYLGRPPFMGRPYVTIQLARAVGKLTALRCFVEKGIEHIAAPKLRPFMMDRNEAGYLEGMQQIDKDDEPMGGRPISLRSSIRLLELYCDELITPPRLKPKQSFNDYDLHMIETSDFSWMDDGGESYLADIQDMPFVTHCDELPNMDAVLDWFLATHPAMDSNQIKRGWPYMERSSVEWHQRAGNYEISEMDISEYPSWKCSVADRHAEWINIFPSENPYRIVPLTTPKQLQAESHTMHHCVVTYIEDCISGETRVFSVIDANNYQPVATAELSNRYGSWELVQLKGKCNDELIERIRVSDDPLAIALGVLVKWYNENAPV